MTLYRIYGLCGPDMVIRYIGRTKCSLEERATNHIATAKRGDRPLHRWIVEQGDALIMRELEQIEHRGSYDSYSPRAAQREAWWIAHFLSEGNDLFNVHQRPKNEPITIMRLVCGLCDRRADDPAVKSCTHTDCGLVERRAA